MIKDMSWKYFAETGDVQAYLLYREYEQEATEKSKQKNREVQHTVMF